MTRLRNQLHWHRRRARKRHLSDTLTMREWRRALRYFGHVCAVCEHAPDDGCALTVDHWIPIADPTCPGTTALNCLPLCYECNHSKGDCMPLDWLRAAFGKEHAHAIAARIERYFRRVTATRKARGE